MKVDILHRVTLLGHTHAGTYYKAIAGARQDIHLGIELRSVG
jgi:hypothetical protein